MHRLNNPEHMIMMRRDRMAFTGPQVESELVLGGYALYVCEDKAFSLIVNNTRSEQTYIAAVPPYTKHRVIGPRNLRSILIEAETVSPDLLEDERLVPGSLAAQAWAGHIESGFRRWQEGNCLCETDSFDMYFFGERLSRRKLDKRVALAVDRICGSPDLEENGTTNIAHEAKISPSRLRHLFREQVGVPIRRFRAWKRLRNAIQIALQEPNILGLAMAAGYADAAHLCHSVKFYFGEQPSFVCAHWRGASFFHTNTRECDDSVRLESDKPLPERKSDKITAAPRIAMN